MTKKPGKLAILVGGGPAPGINSVIAAATIRAVNQGMEVIGIHEGFRWLMRGDKTHIQPLHIEIVSRIHFRGGSILGTARDNPTKKPGDLQTTVDTLLAMGVDKLITIGGDDTAFSAYKVEQQGGGKLRVVHVPKTIDNDIDLPHGVHTFGYETARHVGVELVRNLMIDAKTTSRWYLVISMGRKAGHLALGVGKAVGATVTVIPEEFPEPRIRLSHIVDIIVGAVIKRLALGRADGVAILAEGLVERLDPADFEALATAERDEHGHIRLGEIEFSPIIKSSVIARMRSLGIGTPITTKIIGYELRCAAPIPTDMEYTRDLGYSSAQFIINGGTSALVCIDDGRFKPLYFKDMMDTETGRTRIRMVDIESEYYHIARRYMLRLHREDFANADLLAKMGAVCGLTPEEFRRQFAYLIDEDRLYQLQEPHTKRKRSREDIKVPF